VRFSTEQTDVAFLGRDNVIEVALGIIIGEAFAKVVTSLVTDVLLPPLSLVSERSRNLESHFIVLRHGQHAKEIYNTIEQAAADGTLRNSHLISQVPSIWRGGCSFKR
jgi:large conductance mechanosensitive channel